VLTGAILAACGSSSSHSHTSTAAGTPVPVPVAPGDAAIPVTIRQTPVGKLLLVDVAVGGGNSTPVLLDTGSSGLAILRQAVGPSAAVRPGVRRLGELGGAGNPVTGSQASGSVTVEGSPSATTIKPVAFAAVSSFGPTGRVIALAGAEGVLGIGQLPPNLHGAWSPLLLLGPPLPDGYTIALNATSGPELILGRPVELEGSVTLPLLGPRVASGPFGGRRTPLTYPDGRPAYQGLFKLCWHVAARHTCATTLADSGGNPQGFVGESVFPGLPHVGPILAAGIPVTISTPPPSGVVIHTFTTSTQPDKYTAYVAAPNSGLLSTGNSLFFADTVGYDLIAGQVILTPPQP
jgi:hypothetical protein